MLFFRNGSAFEAMTKTKQENNPKFAFLFGGQYYHYYSYKVATEQQLQRQRAAKEAANNTPRPLMELDLGGGVGGGGGGFYGAPGGGGGGFGGGTSWGGPPEAPRTAPLKEQLAGLQAQQATLQTQIRQSEQVSLYTKFWFIDKQRCSIFS
jgi:calcium homeostasis ER protein